MTIREQQTHELQKMLTQIEASGKRATRQRAIVCEALLAHGGHPTATEIWQAIQDQHPSLSHATVYNTLAALEDIGIIRALDILGEEHTHYDLCVEPHVNVFCKSCGRIVDVHTDTLEALMSLVASRSNYRLDPHDSVVMYGMCPDCART